MGLIVFLGVLGVGLLGFLLTFLNAMKKGELSDMSSEGPLQRTLPEDALDPLGTASSKKPFSFFGRKPKTLSVHLPGDGIGGSSLFGKKMVKEDTEAPDLSEDVLGQAPDLPGDLDDRSVAEVYEDGSSRLKRVEDKLDQKCVKLEQILDEKNKILAQLQKDIEDERGHRGEFESLKGIMQQQIDDLKVQNRALKEELEASLQENIRLHAGRFSVPDMGSSPTKDLDDQKALKLNEKEDHLAVEVAEGSSTSVEDEVEVPPYLGPEELSTNKKYSSDANGVDPKESVSSSVADWAALLGTPAKLDEEEVQDASFVEEETRFATSSGLQMEGSKGTEDARPGADADVIPSTAEPTENDKDLRQGYYGLSYGEPPVDEDAPENTLALNDVFGDEDSRSEGPKSAVDDEEPLKGPDHII